ncbi:DAK2 domain-containing protein [Aerococcus urinaeequi]|uniref:DAK2 domain-containing protein n=2 Tax=Aerococcus urinaeequi TaxID=51665 RepID=A0ABR6A056_9LACT|nr:DAK2 domain-containing protein [Aerococcus urinaeequi]MBA5747355.1 DAK2 domain-containing protein [Aerococcus urinaeequi]MBA5830140.1 DAK2 domain-containing protein [Aerococcus urinaeequi]MBA5861042.1 DAK2 domain-containing protein [Aerococcus urinaeequi]
MLEVGGNRLSENVEYVNSLNVFPVPDGDTGTNMNLTYTSGIERVIKQHSDTVGEVGEDLAKGLLMGARGNSGVILSQLFRGFAKAIEGKTTIEAQDLTNAFQRGIDTAVKAVMKPVEGTILTVARDSAAAGMQKAEESDDIIEVMTAVLEEAQTSLENTPNLLPVLKEVGVVDSGGQGLVYIYHGFLESLTGESIPVKSADPNKANVTELAHQENFFNTSHSVASEDIHYGYCTEIMVKIGEGETVTDEFDYDTFRNHLDGIGDSLLVVSDDEIVKVHVHTETPGEVMNYGQKFGSLVKIKVDNMRLQHDDILDGKGANQAESAPAVERTNLAIIAVAAGEGIESLFKDLGVKSIISGGQTMNPSTNDILDAINKANADNVIILPNNKNIIMAANQAVEVSEIPAAVVETKYISQGLTAMLGYNPDGTLEDNKAAMVAEMANVTSGQVTVAVRDTTVDGLEIHKDHFMGIIDGKIVSEDADLVKETINMVNAMIDEDKELVTLIFGEETDQATAELIAEAVESANEDIEVEIVDGGQPVYHFLASVE